MKRITILTSISLLFLITTVNAQVWRLNNNPGVDADFTTTLQDAIDGVSDGDTIYIEPSPDSYGDAIISKKVILIGAGYWLNENDSTQANKNNSEIGELDFNAGSEGTVVSGLYIYKYCPDNPEYQYPINIYTDSITLQKNWIRGTYTTCSGSNCKLFLITIWGDRKSVIIQQNWIETYCTLKSNVCILVTDGCAEDIIIRNNLLRSQGSYQTNYSLAFVHCPNPGVIINNNIIWGTMDTYNAIHLNNILLDGDYESNGEGLSANNLCNSNQYPDENNNKLNINMSAVFEDYNLYIDKGYKLAIGSPAIGAGYNGGDCGIFGNGFGGYPYRLSGLPAIPSIFEADYSPTVFPGDTTSVQVDIKVKSNRQ